MIIRDITRLIVPLIRVKRNNMGLSSSGGTGKCNIPVPLRGVIANKERLFVVKGRKIYKVSAVITILLWGMSQTLPLPKQPSLLPCTVQAKEPSLPPHLIQSVTAEDFYRGMLAFDLADCPVLAEKDREKARENVRGSVVRIDMGNAYGSGVIFRLTEEGLIIATNRHVLDYWQEEVGVIRFPQGFYASAQSLGSARDCDVGFLKVESGELGMDTLLNLRSVPVDEEAWQLLSTGDEVFCLGADREADELVYQEAVVAEKERYIDTFDGEMLYLHGFAKEGMSGGGIFDGYGHLIGLLAGGTWRGEVAGVPVDQVMAAYREIVGE